MWGWGKVSDEMRGMWEVGKCGGRCEKVYWGVGKCVWGVEKGVGSVFGVWRKVGYKCNLQFNINAIFSYTYSSPCNCRLSIEQLA